MLCVVQEDVDGKSMINMGNGIIYEEEDEGQTEVSFI